MFHVQSLHTLLSYRLQIILQVLNVHHNSINDSGLPADIFSIRDLVTLDLSHNNLTRVPEDMPKARNIIVLSLSHNNITSVPGAVSTCPYMPAPGAVSTCPYMPAQEQ